MATMDVFEGAAFSMRSLTAAVNEVPFVPGQVSSLGLFEEQGVTTTRVSIERSGAKIALVPTSPRGSAGQQNRDTKRTIVDFTIPHIELDDGIVADEIQGVRAFGSETEMMTIAALVNQKNANMARNIDMTMEFQRLGAVKGIVLDADGATQLFDYYTAMGEAAAANVDLDFAALADGALRTALNAVTRAIANAADGLPWTSLHALCGPDFYDALLANAEVRASFLVNEGTRLREGTAYETFSFAGITFEEYRGPSTRSGAGAPTFIAADEAQLFPRGVPGLFISRYAPADYMETVNSVGLPRYAVQRPDGNAPMKRRVLEVQTNPIHMCTRPRMLRTLASV